MIAMVVTIRVKPGQEEVFESRIKIHAALVKENEPGNHLYQLTKKRDQPGVYIVLEMYGSEADFEQHQKMPYFEETARICGAVTIGEPEAEFLDVV
jgi:quinol monooxygenase YgiN